MIDSVALLEDLLSAPYSGCTVESIYVVTPGRLNGAGDWRMERLLRIEHLSEQDSVAHLYVVKNNNTYVDGDRGLTTRMCTQRSVIFTERQEQSI
ncbi:hypothetical protein D3C84_1051620 [compost metagenome]